MQRYFGKIIGSQVLLENDDIFHLTRVMRAKVGEKIEVVNEGVVYLCEVNRFKPLEIDVIKKLNENNELSNRVILIAALIKGDKMDLVLQKATELGVDEIVLVQTERSVVKIKSEEKQVKIERFNKILKEAAEQSRRTRIPRLDLIVKYDRLKDIEADVKMIAYEKEEGSSISFANIIKTVKPKQSIAILVGPEGGFSEKEVNEAEFLGFKKISLGRRILRAETASFYALSVIAHYLERK